VIPHDYTTEWRAQAPWVQDFQIEQDLVISRALVEIFSLGWDSTRPSRDRLGVSARFQAACVFRVANGRARREDDSAAASQRAVTVRLHAPAPDNRMVQHEYHDGAYDRDEQAPQIESCDSRRPKRCEDPAADEATDDAEDDVEE
jgi:hypothetical protein